MTIKLTEEQQYKMLENINLKPLETYLSSITGIQVVLRKVFISAANRPKMNLFMIINKTISLNDNSLQAI